AGAALAVIGLLLSFLKYKTTFLVPNGVLLLILGLGYAWAFVGSKRETADDLAWKAGLGIGALGAILFVVALIWSIAAGMSFLMPQGLIFMVLGLIYMAVCAGICFDHPLILITRRELAAFFYSPIAYVLLVGFVAFAGLAFWEFSYELYVPTSTVSDKIVPSRLAEPIITGYILNWWPVICLVFAVPVLTMHLVSEENRSGTLEMTFTAPVQEWIYVLGKFLAVLIVFHIVWMPWALYLVGLRVYGDNNQHTNSFDYYPAISFGLVLACSGAGFLSMGLFFSSLTRSQIAAAMITFAMMSLLTGIWFGARHFPEDSLWR